MGTCPSGPRPRNWSRKSRIASSVFAPSYRLAPQELGPGGGGHLVGHAGIREQQHAGRALVEDPLEGELVRLRQVGRVLDLDPAVLERVDEVDQLGHLPVGAVGLLERGGDVVARGRRVGAVVGGLGVRLQVAGSFVGQVEPQVAARVGGGVLQVEVLHGWRSGALASVGRDPVDAARRSVDVGGGRGVSRSSLPRRWRSRSRSRRERLRSAPRRPRSQGSTASAPPGHRAARPRAARPGGGPSHPCGWPSGAPG